MSTRTPPDEPSGDEEDWLQPIRDERGGVEEIADRDDRLGATARVLLALDDEDHPREADLAEAGLLGIYYEITEAHE